MQISSRIFKPYDRNEGKDLSFNISGTSSPMKTSGDLPANLPDEDLGLGWVGAPAGGRWRGEGGGIDSGIENKRQDLHKNTV